MSKISKAVKEQHEDSILRKSETVTNFMGGDSYKINPIDTLKLVTASSIFGEPSYYRNGKIGDKITDSYLSNYAPSYYEGLLFKEFENKTTTNVMESVIDSALDYDFEATLNWAVELRKTFNMRLNPQVIMVRASVHPKRIDFTYKYPGRFADYENKVMSRADEPMSQLAYYLYINKGKKNMPSILKRAISNKLGMLSRYDVAKYKNSEIGMINATRIVHANSEVLNELMKNGTVEISSDKQTWENMKSAGANWKTILNTISIGHMALLRNLRNIFNEIEDIEYCKKIMQNLKDGVLEGKQFPYRYFSAYKAIEDSGVFHKSIILDTLEECIDISIANMPKIKGKTMCLSDNSGSAWGNFQSEYGSMTTAEIDNLSSVITAMCSDEGYVGKFGDKLKIYPISKRNGALKQAKEISKNGCNDIGGSTEGGIWEFFNNAINKKEHWDNIFIYSDQQAGHGGLYGTAKQYDVYCKKYADARSHGSHINVYKLILDYRARVNKKVNAFSIQTAGYDNVCIPEYAYRTNIMYGWTGKEALFANAIINEWNRIDNKN